MTNKQLQAAKRQLALLKRIRKNLEECNTAGCITLEQVNEQALKTNAECIWVLEERLKLAKTMAA